jgi:hypothetical protein
MRDDLGEMPPEKPVEWYLARDGHQYGPLSDDEKIQSSGTCSGTTCSGAKGLRIRWRPARRFISGRKSEGRLRRVGDYGPSMIVVAWACDRDGRYSCGDDVGVALRRLAYGFIRRGRGRARVPTERIL